LLLTVTDCLQLLCISPQLVHPARHNGQPR
jgi:hypothetical protein